jgi:hypothetical protein
MIVDHPIRSQRLRRNLKRFLPMMVLLLVASACRPTSISDAVAAGELVEFPGIDGLAETFNDDAGFPRLILSLSPT